MHELAVLLPHGVAPRDAVTLASSSSSVSRWLRDGEVVLLHPGVLALADRRQEWTVRARAATLWARGPLSHGSALAHWGLLTPDDGPVHVTVPTDRWPRGDPSVIAHRTTLPMQVVQSDGVSVLPVTRSIVDAWGWAHTPRRNLAAAREVPDVRQVLIESVRRRTVSVIGLRAESALQQVHGGRASLRELLDLVAGGCQSELEIWGALQVLPGGDLPPYVQQHRVQLPSGRWAHLDAAYLAARVAVELDGAAFHGSREQRERDIRRDTALAALGWLVLRYSYALLTGDPEACRCEIDTVVRRRLVEL